MSRWLMECEKQEWMVDEYGTRVKSLMLAWKKEKKGRGGKKEDYISLE